MANFSFIYVGSPCPAACIKKKHWAYLVKSKSKRVLEIFVVKCQKSIVCVLVPKLKIIPYLNLGVFSSFGKLKTVMQQHEKERWATLLLPAKVKTTVRETHTHLLKRNHNPSMCVSNLTF